MKPSRIAIHFYCRRIIINNKSMLDQQGPLLIAANHPNSFLDAIIIATLFKSPVYSLARGDVFIGKIINKIWHSFNVLPIYRISEGSEKLENNYTTFEACQKLFEQKKIVLIFSEGQCVNEWKLRPLKKGTARLAITAWQQNIPLKVLPAGINYSSFKKYGKTLILNFGNIIEQNELHENMASGKAIHEFNKKLKIQLETLVYEIQDNDPETLKRYFFKKTSFIEKAILFFPAMIGFILNAPLYTLIHLIIKRKAADHYDSIMTGLLFFLYPLYILLITLMVVFITKNLLAFFLLLLFPLSTLCYLHFKNVIPANKKCKTKIG
ncbi:MAG: 1-acyl-sn-glycerol-3-phosphate acyltransferase [Bacteroidota bacterium]|nr:1-acyl-sn-glycerol-3-phosphate acyltransferase [Bacteroidota bacterium]